MRLPRKLLLVLAIGIATLSFAGVSAALEADPAPQAPPVEQALPDEDEQCPDSTGNPEGDEDTTDEGAEAADVVEGASTGEDDDCDEAEVEADDDPAKDEVDEGPVDEVDEVPVDEPEVTSLHPDNHGAAVSDAAHTCPTGPAHGACVSEVARSDAGKDRQEPDDSDDSDELHPRSNGKGGGRG